MGSGPDFSSMTDTEFATYKTAVDAEDQRRKTVTAERVTAVQNKVTDLYGLDVSPDQVRVILSAAADLDGA